MSEKQPYEWRDDSIADAGYLKLREAKVHRTLTLHDQLNLDFDEEGNVVGVEFIAPTPRS